MRVHYPKLRNIVHTISLSMFLLLPKDQTYIFYSVAEIAVLRVSFLINMLTALKGPVLILNLKNNGRKNIFKTC